ncbi:MAG TPA: VOC family protein [Acidimicrobiales bacterium]|nr:VOC family protein [Acidimicrobiales bacterium]
MATRFWSVVIDAADPSALARFWSALTGWPITYEEPDEVVVEPPSDAADRYTEPGFPLVFGLVDDVKQGKNKVHLDLNSNSAEHQAALVARAERAGARRLDIGQGDVPWTVLADPDGNEFCILEHRATYAAAGVIAAVVVDVPDPGASAGFWSAATGWPVLASDDDSRSLAPPDGAGPRLELLAVSDPKVAKDRVHIDVAPYAGDDQAADVERLRGLGATDADIGQGVQRWVVLRAPDGHELCVLTPR